MIGSMEGLLAAVILGTLVGVTIGTITGLVPGIHANTLAVGLLGLSPFLIPLAGGAALVVAMVAAMITHAFLDAVPATFLGVPEPDTALSVLPAHALCLEGRGEEAVRVAALGAAAGILLALPLAALFIVLLPPVQPLLDWVTGVILVSVAAALIFGSGAVAWSGGVFLLSGVLGTFSLRYGFLCAQTGGESAVLMPLLAGLFGLPVLLTASSTPAPPQRFSGMGMGTGAVIRGGIAGTVSGALVGWFPGLSNAAANAILAPVFGIDRDRKGFILAASAAGTANAVIGIAALYAISRERSGVMAAISAIGPPDLVIVLAGVAAAAVLAYMITLTLARHPSAALRFSGKRGTFAIVAFIVGMSVLTAGPFGLLVLVLATLTGAVPPLVNIPRVLCIGSVTVPVTCFAFGIAL